MARVSRRTEETYRLYRIIAGQRGEHFVAVAYAGKVQMFTATGDSLDGVVDTIKQIIEEHLTHRAELRGAGQIPIPDFELALNLVSPHLSAAQQHLLERAAASSEAQHTIRQLKGKSEFTEEALIQAFGRLARQVAEALDLPLSRGPGGGEAALQLICDSSEGMATPQSAFVIRPQFLAAVHRHMPRGRSS